jgi:hypothetical protein
MECGCTILVDEDDEFIDYDEICDMHASEQCMDCEKHQREFDEYYMVHAEIWYSVVIGLEEYGLLCIGCLEDRLGRELTPKDFTSFSVNSKENARRYSWRQKRRMGYPL